MALHWNAMTTAPLVLLTIDTDIGRIAARRLAARFPGMAIVVEERVSRWSLLRARTKRLGAVHVAGQLAFMALNRVLIRLARPRVRALFARSALDDRWPDGCPLVRVASVNAAECVAALNRMSPKAVLVIGTRIISRQVLAAVSVPFINYHAGITPKYRGIHGGYWAKAQGDLENFGVTVHLVDAGVDTGAVLYQARLSPEPGDNYATFPYLQLAAGLSLLEQAAQDALDGKLAPVSVDLPSRNWSHPTIWGYLLGGLTRGAW
jgi:hypothetical protein